MGNRLPKNWVEINLGQILWVKNGFAFKSKSYIEDGIPIIRMSDIVDNEIAIFKAARVKPEKQFDNFIIKKGDILIGMSGSIGKYGIFNLNETVYLNQRVGNLKLYSEDLINKKLVYYLIGFIQQKIVESSYGGAVPNISSKQIEQTKFNLPPKAEQERIVVKLDELFGKLESVKTRMETIPGLLKNFRQAILTQAVTGKLTEEWRKGKELEEWKLVESSKVFEFVTSGSRGWAKYYDDNGKQLFVRITNMNYGTMELDLRAEKCRFLKLPNTSEGKRTLLQSKDILISITADVGMISLIPDNWDFEAYVNQHVCLARPIKNINEVYLSLYLMSEAGFGQLKDRKRGATKAGLTLGDIKSLNIEVPSLKEQTEIVKRVESLFGNVDKIEERYKALKTQINSLPQAIMAKAFKGELVEQLPTDGNAKDLLKEIAKLKAEIEQKKIGKRSEVSKVAEEQGVYNRKK